MGTELLLYGNTDYAMFRGWDTLYRVKLYGTQFILSNSFQNCSALAELSLPEGLEMLSAYAFSYCTALTAVHLPASLASISSSCFTGCTPLTTVTVGEDFHANLTLAYTGITDRTLLRAIIDAYRDRSAYATGLKLTLSQTAYAALSEADKAAAVAKNLTLLYL